MLLLHAGVADSRMWNAQWPAWSAARDVIRYDARGFGRSPDPIEPWSRHEDALAVMDAAAIEDAHLVAASMGGYTALELAAVAPGRVRSIVIAAGAAALDPPPDLETTWERIDALVEAGDVDAANEEEMRLWVDGRRNPPPRGAAMARDAIAPVNRELLDRQRAFPDERELDPPLPERLADIACPVLVVSGDADVPIAIEWCEILARQIPGARLVTWENVAHMLTLERPDQFAELVLAHTA